MIYLCILFIILTIAATVVATWQTSRCRTLSSEISHYAESVRMLELSREHALDEVKTTALSLAKAEERVASLDRELETLRHQMKDNEANFSRLSAITLQEQSRNFQETNERRLNELLTPLTDRLTEFRRQIEECYSTEARERFALRSAIGDLMNQTQSIGREARELANALRNDSKTQGDWGEMILQRLLENSGLREGEEFKVQLTRDAAGNILRNDDGSALRPDVVVFLPGERAIVIDSKVSLTAYADWTNAAGEEERRLAGKRHTESVKSHINELRDKRYQDYIGERRLDFVMMFMPNEGSYLAAMSLDESLWQYAFDNHVLIVSPTHLMSVLRLTAQLWASDRQTANALKIAIEAGRIHDKVAAFADDMKRIYQSLEQASSTWHSAMTKLTSGNGNILKKADDLRRLGARTARRINVPFDGDTNDEDTSIIPD